MAKGKCPYCGEDQNLDTDEMYEDSEERSQDCEDCGKEFSFYCSVDIDYYVNEIRCDYCNEEFEGGFECCKNLDCILNKGQKNA